MYTIQGVSTGRLVRLSGADLPGGVAEGPFLTRPRLLNMTSCCGAGPVYYLASGTDASGTPLTRSHVGKPETAPGVYFPRFRGSRDVAGQTTRSAKIREWQEPKPAFE